MHIGALLESRKTPFLSLEFFPPAEDAQLPPFYEVVSTLKTLDPLFASVTYGAGGSKQDRTLAVTAKICEMGLTTMAHLTCIGATEERIRAFLQALEKAGVMNVLALRGDPPKDTTIVPENMHFRHASDLVHFIRNEFPSMGIGVAAYPTPHPESESYAADRYFLAEKLSKGADFAVTQLFFDVREYVAMVDRVRKHNCNQPIIPGILTIQSIGSLRRILSLSGAHIPGKLYLALEEADQKGGAEAVREAGIRFAADEIRRLLDAGAPGVHLYTLNRAEICLELARLTGLMPKERA
ncbi:MAG: methylenetetrahydrofolate reductase [Desulfovibrio sp.]|nr:methylenetetrahydrofolate reductase [Desulfovibrio sp.]